MGCNQYGCPGGGSGGDKGKDNGTRGLVEELLKGSSTATDADAEDLPDDAQVIDMVDDMLARVSTSKPSGGTNRGGKKTKAKTKAQRSPKGKKDKSSPLLSTKTYDLDAAPSILDDILAKY